MKRENKRIQTIKTTRQNQKDEQKKKKKKKMMMIQDHTPQTP